MVRQDPLKSDSSVGRVRRRTYVTNIGACEPAVSYPVYVFWLLNFHETNLAADSNALAVYSIHLPAPADRQLQTLRDISV